MDKDDFVRLGPDIPTAEMLACEHEDFEVLAEVGRLTAEEDGPVTNFVVEVAVRCMHCQRPFAFPHFGRAIDVGRPCVDITKCTVSLPMVPGPEFPESGATIPVRPYTAPTQM